ncbi:cytochrome c3 family protein [Anaeromyxobacter terrae]|uniref:cytochrome c3 family protein n=1 Tax=Anaeromyxobacter terrae TaxID=2925406 RepID=UPI001F564271|nr:cytochrome c3 family protein [Anaeromyxobacter sp. SG22]
MKKITLALLLSGVVAAAPAGAIDAPHDRSFCTGSCNACHKTHSAPGGAITIEAGNANLCASCHKADRTLPDNRLKFPWTSGEQAVPRTSGVHHRWDAPAQSAEHGAQTPTSPALSALKKDGTLAYLPGGKLQCSTCHDVHKANPAFAPDRVHASLPTGVFVAGNGAVTGNGTLRLDPPAAGAAARGYLVEITVGGSATAARFKLSNDNGASWWGFSTGTWVAYSASPENGRSLGGGATVTLNDPAVGVAFGVGTFAVGDQWKFYVSYPHLRAELGSLCDDCHRERVQDHSCIEGGAGCVADGVRTFSHPVGEALDANAQGYDRVAAGAPQILDADGRVQGSAGSNGAGDPGGATNDLRLDAQGRVRCTSCHSPHNADSNALTVD